MFWYNYFNDQTLNFYIRGGVMKEVLYFYSPGCPFCKKADKFIAQAIEENPDFAKVEIKRIDEVAQKEYAASFDYYYVPCIYVGGEKVIEGKVNKFAIDDMFEQALGE